MNPCQCSGTPVFVTEKTLNLAQAAATYDAATASGDVLVESVCLYCTVVGATFTSVAVASNQAVPVVLMTAAEGAVANIVAGSHPNAQCQLILTPWTLRSGQKIQYTLVGAAGTGELRMVVNYRPISTGAVL